MPHIVTGALLRDGRVLLGHRCADRRAFPDRWDLPGGHVEPGEEPAQALVRELREEIGVRAAVTGAPALRLEIQSDDADDLVLDVWAVTRWEGDPANLATDEHDDLRWVSAAELPGLDLAHPRYERFLPDLLSRPLHDR